jgi:DNA-binding CsgD family transcriptional regulator
MTGHALLVRAGERAAETDVELAVAIFAEAVDACFCAGDAREMRGTAECIEELLQDTSSVSARFLAFVARGMALVMCGEGESGIAAIREGVALAESRSGVGDESHLLPWLVAGPLWLRELDTGASLIAFAIEQAREHVSLDVLPWLLERVARSHAATDRWSRAEVEYDEAIRLARETGQRAELAAAIAGLAWLEARLGREQDCRGHAAESGALCGELGMGLYQAWTLRALGELELGLGQAAAATGHLERLEEHLDSLGIGDVDLSPAPELIDAYVRVGRLEDAHAAAARLETRAREKGQPWSLARAERCLGMLADSDYEHHFEDALRLHELTPDLFERASTQLAFGARLRRDRRRVLAREQLRSAVEIFERLGAVKLYERAEAELRATGESARRRDPSTLDQLTPQELHIAQLLAAGRTTREAAASLFLSPKTIEYHLRSVYRKLGVKSREDLRAVIAPAELDP